MGTVEQPADHAFPRGQLGGLDRGRLDQGEPLAGKPPPAQPPFRRHQPAQRTEGGGARQVGMTGWDKGDQPVGVDREQGPGEPRSRISCQVHGHLHPAASADRPWQPASQRRGETDMGGPRGRGIRGAVADEHQPATVEAGRGRRQQLLGGRR